MAPSSGDAAPLVGRDRELAILSRQLDAALGGRGSLVLIGGEAGIGKTALAEALCRDASERGALVLVGCCYDLTETPPYGPWVELFGRYRHADGDLPGGMPPLPAAFAERGTVGAVESQATLFQQVREFVTALASARPLVLLLDDLHWADPASLDLLRSLARSVADLPALLIATYRSDELTRRHPLYTLLPLLVREARAARLDLRHLDADAVRDLIAARYRLPTAETARLVSAVQARTEGNALFLGEVLRALEEGGTLRRDGGVWTLGALSAMAVPPLLAQVIERRLSRLGEDERRLLGVAAVIGHEVLLDIWAAVSDAEEDALLDVAERGQEARLLVEGADGEAIRFAHALIREAIYEGIPAIRRRRVHRRAAEALAAARHPDPDAVASHFQHAGDARAAPWLIKAGERAAEAYATLTAAARFEAALTLMEEYGMDTVVRTRLLLHLAAIYRFSTDGRARAYLDEARAMTGADPLMEAYALLLGGLVHWYENAGNRGLAEMEEGVARLAALPAHERARAGEVPHSVRQALDEDGVGTFVVCLAHNGRLAEAIALGERVVAATPGRTAGGAGDPPRGDAYWGLAMVNATLGRPDAARGAFARSVAEYHAAGNHMLEASALIWQSWAHLAFHADDWAGTDHLRAAIGRAMGESVGYYAGDSAFSVASLLFVRGEWEPIRAAFRDWGQQVIPARLHLGAVAHVVRYDGDVARLREIIETVLPGGPETPPGDVNFRLGQTLQRVAALLALDAGDLPEAREWLEAHERWLAWSGAVLGQSEGQALWAQYYRQAGNREQAYAHAERAHAHASDPRQPLALIAAHRLLGELSTAAGDREAAARYLRDALALADACRAPHEHALTLLATAELRAAHNEREAAARLLDGVRAICETLGDRLTLARADVLAERLAAVPPAAPPRPAGLSAREAEVLRLVAQGLTNPQIAERLFLSPRTVTTHLTSIYTKLGVATRAAATRFAIEHGLA